MNGQKYKEQMTSMRVNVPIEMLPCPVCGEQVQHSNINTCAGCGKVYCPRHMAADFVCQECLARCAGPVQQKVVKLAKSAGSTASRGCIIALFGLCGGVVAIIVLVIVVGYTTGMVIGFVITGAVTITGLVMMKAGWSGMVKKIKNLLLSGSSPA